MDTSKYFMTDITKALVTQIQDKQNEFTRLLFTKIFPEEVIAIMDSAHSPNDLQANSILINQLGLRFEITNNPNLIKNSATEQTTRIVRLPRNKNSEKIILGELKITFGVECMATISFIRSIDEYKHTLWSPIIRRWLRSYAARGNEIARKTLDSTSNKFFGVDWASGPDQTVRVERGEISDGGSGEISGAISVPEANLESCDRIEEGKQIGDGGLPPSTK